jgi:endoglucanase
VSLPRASLGIAALALVAAAPAPIAIALNQTGFAPGDPKTAIVSGSAEPVAWTLVDAGGRTVAEGRSRPYGDDPASGQQVQRIDFSGVRTLGKGYRLVVNGVRSDPFAIQAGLYAPLARDAVAFFYHQRAGVPIEARFVGAEWARPAGHTREVVRCFEGKDERGTQWPGCDYTRDVTGGWYDAGDHGKYVVNGGISLWTLLNAYERRPGAFPDKSLRIPEAGNGVSDLLDEARFEMEFFLKMQAPAGTRAHVPVGPALPPAPGEPAWKTRAPGFAEIDAGGMAHQKVADAYWTGLPMLPHKDPAPRLLYPVTTGATLNLAATAAQCARIWREIDDAFAARCLTAAKSAYAAALRNPQVYATSSFTGSGGYGDNDVSDEFYWAAAELYATTGEAGYAADLRKSPHFGAAGDFGWPNVETLGTITLARVRNGLPAADVARMRAALVGAADRFLADAAGNGFRIPFGNKLPWGSNSNLLNRAIVLGYAQDLTGDAKYRAGVVDAMDYVLGRNPLRVSYVSGYGARSMRNPHHRFWAKSKDSSLPGPPPGVLSGGPNSGLSEEDAKRVGRPCVSQTCWADDIDAYTLNEVTINWNAPLFWVAAWMGD